MSKVDDLAAIVAAQGEEIAALRAELAARPPAPARKTIPAPPRIEEGVRILTGANLPSWARTTIVLPTDDELRALIEIVVTANPVLELRVAKETDRERAMADAFRRVRLMFDYLAELPRRAKYDNRGVDWWCDSARNWAGERGITIDFGRRCFVVAALCHGDIRYRALGNYPYDLYFGISLGAGDSRYSEAWRQVLATGRARAPSDPVVYSHRFS